MSFSRIKEKMERENMSKGSSFSCVFERSTVDEDDLFILVPKASYFTPTFSLNVQVNSHILSLFYFRNQSQHLFVRT